MSQATSFLLDALRLAAALTVFAAHCLLLWYPTEAQGIAGALGHRAVIVFFVLSGCVIAASTFRKKRDARAYVLARLSRLYSVTVPALVLTLVLGVAGAAIHPGFYRAYEHGHGALSYLLTGLFLQSLWMTNTAPPENAPFWSLGYEFWYYALFGAAVMIRPQGWKMAVVLALALLVGPSVLLLLPAWVMGVLLYLYGARVKVPVRWALAGGILSLSVLILTVVFLPDWPHAVGYQPCFYSNAFVSDNGSAVLLCGSIFFFDQVFKTTAISDRLAATMRWMGDHTFSLYLYHFPLLLFVGAVVPFDRSSPLQLGTVIGGVLAVIAGLGMITESKRGLWRGFFAWCWDGAFRKV